MIEKLKEILAEEEESAADEQEIVSWYVPRRREGEEVVSYYVQPTPLPRKLQQAQTAPKKRSRRGLWIFLACIAVMVTTVVLAVIFAPDNGRPHDGIMPDGEDASSIIDIFGTEKTTIPTYKGDPAVRLQVQTSRGPLLTPQQVYAAVNPSTVTVVAVESREKASVGTGVIMTADGYIITNAHVIAGAASCWIALDTGVTYDALLVGYDERQDLAVLKALDAQDLPAAQFGDSDRVVVGDTAYAIGNPLGLELRGTMTDGMISAVNRAVEMGGHTMTLLQTTAALNNGNSGGPLINAYGQVIGINVMKMSNNDMQYEASVEGLGFALPISDMYYVVNDLIAYGEFRGTPVLGITVITVSVEGGGTAVMIHSVSPASGADKAGLQEGDVSLAVNGEEVFLTEELLMLRRAYGIGDEMPLTLLRDGEVMEVTVTLSADPLS